MHILAVLFLSVIIGIGFGATENIIEDNPTNDYYTDLAKLMTQKREERANEK